MSGVMQNYDAQTGEFDYIACMQAHNASSVPQGMTALSIPKQTYAVFTTALPTEARLMDASKATGCPNPATAARMGRSLSCMARSSTPATRTRCCICHPGGEGRAT